MPDLTTCQSLSARATHYASLLSNVAADDQGIVRTCIHHDGPRPLTEQDLPADFSQLGVDCSLVGFACYEDAGMTTGAYLAAQCHRYRATGDPEALRLAARAFDGIRCIYELGQSREAGYFPKPYDGKVSDHISRDQYLYAMNGMAAYHPLASRSVQAEIEEMVARMAGYWMRHQYRAGYFSLPEASHLDDFMGALFLGIIGIAAELTGETSFHDEFDRLFTQEKLGSRMSETLRQHFRDGHTYDGATYFRQQENPMAMKAMAIDFLWDSSPHHRASWRRALQCFWDDDLLVSLDRDSGLNYYIVGYDRRQDKTFMTSPGVIAELENPLALPGLNWGGRRQGAGSTQTAFAAAIIAHRLGHRGASETTRAILDCLELEHFRGWTVPSPDHLPPGEAWHTETYQSCYLAYWLWAYWLGRARGILTD